jgi:hypothetical protein
MEQTKMKRKIKGRAIPGMALAGFILGGGAQHVSADEHCGDLGDCRVLIEMNASDGDIGFHTLFDGDAWERALMKSPGGDVILDEQAFDGSAALATQGVTENFFESSEPSCDVQDLPAFLGLFPVGEYSFDLDGNEGSTILTHDIPAAPAEVEFNGKDISWEYGDDFGECSIEGYEPIGENDIVAYEVVMEPDVDDPVVSNLKFTIRVPATVNKIRVPKAYLASLARNTPLKVEVGAIELRGGGVNPYGNQTFTEEDGFCNNPSQTQCEEEDDE